MIRKLLFLLAVIPLNSFGQTLKIGELNSYKVFAAFLNAAVRNPNLAALNQEMTKDARSVYETVIRRAIMRGELDTAVDVQLLTDILISPFLYRLLVDNSEARPEDVGPVIDMAIKAFGLPR